MNTRLFFGMVVACMSLCGCTYNIYHTATPIGPVGTMSHQDVATTDVVAPAPLVAVAPPPQAQSGRFQVETKYKKVHNVSQPQKLTYVIDAASGATYIGDEQPDLAPAPGLCWVRPEVAARNPAFPNDETKAIWVKIWAMVPKDSVQH